MPFRGRRNEGRSLAVFLLQECDHLLNVGRCSKLKGAFFSGDTVHTPVVAETQFVVCPVGCQFYRICLLIQTEIREQMETLGCLTAKQGAAIQ